MDPHPPPLAAVSPAPIETLEGRRLLLLLHGRGADEHDLLPLADALGLPDPVIAVRAPVPLDGGASWAEGTRDEILRGRGISAAAERVLALLDGLPAGGLGTPAEVVPLGFSQGGAVALAMARLSPGRFGRLVLLSGFVPDDALPGDDRLRDDPPAVLWGRGELDEVIPEDAVARTAAWLGVHARGTVRTYPGLGHGISAEELADVRAFLAPTPG